MVSSESNKLWTKMPVEGIVTEPTDHGDEESRFSSKFRFKFKTPSANMPPPKTTLAALFMLGAGTVFLMSGIYVYFGNLRIDSDRGLSMVVLGFLMFTPGSYASFVLYGACQGWNGYDYSQIPSYDEID